MRLIFVLFCLISLHSWADDSVFASVGAYGEAHFSDMQSDGAQQLFLFIAPSSQAAIEQAKETLAATIAIAQELENARIARKQANSERANRLQGFQDEPAVNGYPQRYGYPQHFVHLPHQDPAPAIESELPHQPFAPVFRPVSPALRR